jgi:hypothetical protein
MTYLTASPRRRQTRDQARSFDRLDRILATIPDHRQQPGRRDRAARVRDVVVDQAALDAANHPLGGLKRREYQKILDAYYAGQRRIEKEPTPVGDHCAGLRRCFVEPSPGHVPLIAAERFGATSRRCRVSWNKQQTTAGGG